MIAGRIPGATRALGAPAQWDDVAGELPCGTLPIRDEVIDGLPFMASAWLPTPEELARLNEGASIELRIFGRGHPVVSVGVGEAPE